MLMKLCVCRRIPSSNGMFVMSVSIVFCCVVLTRGVMHTFVIVMCFVLCMCILTNLSSVLCLFMVVGMSVIVNVMLFVGFCELFVNWCMRSLDPDVLYSIDVDL